MPKALYKLLRTEGEKNPNPMVMQTGHTPGTSSRQVADRLLCGACEERFNTNGERWVLANLYKSDESFRLLKLLEGAPTRSVFPGHPARIVATSSLPKVEIDKLAYFAVSIGWRAAVRQWALDKRPLKPITLPEERLESLRRYLMAETTWPAETYLWVTIPEVGDTPLRNMVNFPFGGYEADRIGHHFHAVRFIVPGLSFALMMGVFVPSIAKDLCTVTSRERFIHFDDMRDDLLKRGMGMMGPPRTFEPEFILPSPLPKEE